MQTFFHRLVPLNSQQMCFHLTDKGVLAGLRHFTLTKINNSNMRLPKITILSSSTIKDLHGLTLDSISNRLPNKAKIYLILLVVEEYFLRKRKDNPL